MNIWLKSVLIILLDITLRILLQEYVWVPDLMLIFLAYLTLSDQISQAYKIAFTLGLAWDGMFFDYMGLHSFLFITGVYFTSKLKAWIWAQYFISRLFLGLLLSGGMRFAEVLFWLSFDPVRVSLELIYYYIAGGALLTGLTFLFITWNPRPVKIANRVVVFGER
ncbi:MAG: rod shape-determining protein MreD [bacterium]|jgi:rod shape-determining protein MreD